MGFGGVWLGGGGERRTDVDLVLSVVGGVPRVSSVDDVADGVQTVELVEHVELYQRGIVFLGCRLCRVFQSFVHFRRERYHADCDAKVAC